MPIIPERSGGLFVRDDDEDLFSRDINGQLVRLDAPTQADYDKQVTLQIDGQSVTVPLAEPLKDANGNVVQDMEGKTTPRYTTIYDAAMKLYGDEAAHDTGRGLPSLRCPNLRTEARQTRGRTQAAARLSAPRERRDGSVYHERAGTGR